MNGGKLTLKTKGNDTVRYVKQLIAEEENIPVDLQRLVFAGKQLENGEELYTYNIQHQSTLSLLQRLPGDQ